MGFFSSLLNSKSKGVSQISNSMGVIDREDLACRLIRLRKKMDLISRGESESEAIKKSEVYIEDDYIRDFEEFIAYSNYK